MVAFAANSLFARLALSQTATDPAAFSVIRLASGAVLLLAFVAVRHRRLPFHAGSWWSALALFMYAVAFSYAYVRLSTGTGALILFGAVQVTMVCFGIIKGERLSPAQWCGFTLACLGVTYLVSPGISAPSLSGSALMASAGVAWAAYTLTAGKADPTVTSAGNFIRTVPMCVALALIAMRSLQVDAPGLIYALLSGMFTSGVGYIVWYMVLPQISVVNASTIQLSVPALAALMGVAVVDEPLTLRLVLAAATILIGISVVLRFRKTTPR